MGTANLDQPIWGWPFLFSPYGSRHLGTAHMGAAILDLLIWEQPFWMGIPVAKEIPVARHVALLRTSPLLGNHVMGYPRPLLGESLPPHAWVSEWVSECRDEKLLLYYYFFGLNLAILAWTGSELSRGQANDWHTDRHTHTQTQATTIPEGQNWLRVKREILFFSCTLMYDHF